MFLNILYTYYHYFAIINVYISEHALYNTGKEGTRMISYEPLTNTLKERNMKRSDLRQHMSSATIAKLANNEFLSLKTIDTICQVLHCRIEDVAIYVEEKEDEQPVEGNEPT